MSAAHTAGPWAQHPDYPWIIKQDMQPIAGIADGVTVCNTTAHESSGFFPSPEEGRANARLIAAAPELLAFAQEFLRDYSSEDGVASMKVYAKQAAAAIAKATGSAQ